MFSDYGKYVPISVKHVLFVFAGAFNGEEEITLDRLREMGLKTELLGRIGLIFNTPKISLESMIQVMKESAQLEMYLHLFPNVKRATVEKVLTEQITEAYGKNTLGFRLITTLLNQYFIKGGKVNQKDTKKVTFQRTLSLEE